jgi:hypothetical protein
MRCSGWSSRAISVCSAFAVTLAGAGAASAHVIPTPNYIPSEGTERISFSGLNERERTMTGFTLIAPAGLEIEHAHPVPGWTEQRSASKATWTGGSLAPAANVAFGLTMKATAKPGIVLVQAEQSYPGGGIVTWPVPLTVVPPEKSPSQNLALAGVVGLIGVLTVVAIGMVAWRRRAPGVDPPASR